MSLLGLQFELILSSPLVRAIETAEIVREKTGSRCEIPRTDALLPDSSLRKVYPSVASSLFLLETPDTPRAGPLRERRPRPAAGRARWTSRVDRRLRPVRERRCLRARGDRGRPARSCTARTQTRARGRRAAPSGHPARTRARDLALRRDRRLARAARLDAEDVARRDPRYQVERKLRFRSRLGGRRFALSARAKPARSRGGSRSSSTVRRGEASRRRGASVRLRVSRLPPAYAPTLGLWAARM